MFSKRKKSEKSSDTAMSRELQRLLRDAVDRNATIGIVRLGYSGQDPLAQGRLIKWDDEGIIVEKVQIIGRDVRLTLDTRIEAFIKMNDTTIVFESKIISKHGAARLNENQVVETLRISQPQLLRKGDRRSAFRSSVNASGDEIPVRMWFIDRVEEDADGAHSNRSNSQMYYTDLVAARRRTPIIPQDENGNELSKFDWDNVVSLAQESKPHAIGRLVDLTSNGLGVLMYGIAKMQLTRFERIAMQFELEGESLDVVVEMRHGNDLRGSTCKVGTLIIHPQIGNLNAPQKRLLERVAIQVQRDQLRHRRAG